MSQDQGQTAAVDQKDPKILVPLAFALGWHMTELYHFDKVGPASWAGTTSHGANQPAARPPEPGGTPELTLLEAAAEALKDSLPGLGDLERSQRKSILIRQAKHDLPDVWTDVDVPMLIDLLQKIDEAAESDESNFCSLIAEIHQVMLEGLTVADYRLGKSYGLGRALAETTIIPCAIASGRGLGGHRSEKQLGEAFQAGLLGEFESGRVFTLQAWLLDLRDWFPDHAADAVATTLGGWSLWAFRPTIGKLTFDWDDDRAREGLERALRRQGDMWRGLLSGEKDPRNIVAANFYFAAMASVVRKMARLALQFLGTAIGLVLFLAVVVAILALYFSSTTHSNTGTLAAVVGLLSALGITTGSIGASVQKAWSKAEDPLWEAEVSAAVANAAWQNPAPLGSVEAIQLLMAVGEKADARTETLARHPNLTILRNVPVGRLGIVLMVISTAVALFAADAGHLNRDASFFLPPLCIVLFLVLIDAWDLLIGLAARQTAPYLALPERIELPAWIAPVAQFLTPTLLIAGLLAGHFFWH